MEAQTTGPGPNNLIHRLDRDAGSWFVLHTRSRQEKAVAQVLATAGAGCYLPLRESVRYYGRRKARVETPLFPGYVFMHGDIDAAYAVDRCKRLAQVIRVPDQQQLAESLAAICAVQARGGQLEPHALLRAGEWVEVTAGPFKGLCGVVDRIASPDRLVIQVDVLGQGSCLEIDGGLLVPIDGRAVATA